MGEEKNMKEMEALASLVAALTAIETAMVSVGAAVGKLRELIGPPVSEPPKTEPVGPPVIEPAKPRARTGDLYDFIRPGQDDPATGVGVVMTGPDPIEAVERARHGVNWLGTIALTPEEQEKRWAIIEKLKEQDAEVLPFYSMLDPAFCGLALLTNVIEPHTSDALSFGTTARRREAFAGTTVASWVGDNLTVYYGGGTPSGA